MPQRFLVDKQSKTPVYRQIADCIHFAINTGSLAPGERLPSLRAIAQANHCALNTVVKAFRVLEEKALINGTSRQGFTVIFNHTGSHGNNHVGVAVSGENNTEASGDTERYAGRGVSADKKEVHAAVDKLDRGVFPGAFCKLTDDFLTGDPDRCNVTHSDGCGTKSILAYLHWKETGDASVFRGIAQDSIVMNLDDLACIGCVSGILLSSTINRNARSIPGEVLAQLIEGTEAFLQKLREWGIGIHSGGGETADVGDLTPTLTVDSCATAVLHKHAVIDAARIEPGLAIIGLSSAGRATYEEADNSGIGSNGLTSARHDLLKSTYRKKYPETCDANTKKELLYCGPFKLQDALPGAKMSVGQALLSPTRTFAPVVALLLKECRAAIRGLVHCSGGGQTKCLRFGNGVHFVKEHLLPLPPVFKAIQKASKTKWREMYKVYNMGHRLEVYCPKADAEAVIAVAQHFGITAAVIGETAKSDQKGGANHLTLQHGKKALKYNV